MVWSRAVSSVSVTASYGDCDVRALLVGVYTRHPVSQYIVRKKDQVRRGTRRVPEKVITLTPAILQ